VVPVTAVGRGITIVYAIFGIPLCLVVLASLGKLLTRAIKYLWMFLRRFYYTGSCRRVRRLIPVSRLRMTLLQRIGFQLHWRGRRFRRAIRRRNVSEPDTQKNEVDDFVPYEVDDEFNLPPAVALIIGMTYTLVGALMYKSWENWTYFEAFYFTCISLSTIGFGDVVPDHPNFFIVSSIYMLIGLALLSMVINVIMVAMNVTITKVTTGVMEVGQQLVEQRNNDVIEPEITVSESRPQYQSPPLTSFCHSPPIHRRRSV